MSRSKVGDLYVKWCVADESGKARIFADLLEDPRGEDSFSSMMGTAFTQFVLLVGCHESLINKKLDTFGEILKLIKFESLKSGVRGSQKASDVDKVLREMELSVLDRDDSELESEVGGILSDVESGGMPLLARHLQKNKAKVKSK